MKATLATIRQLDKKTALGVIQTFGSKTGLSDLAIILGAKCSFGDTDIQKKLAGWIWTSSPYDMGYVILKGGRNNNATNPLWRSNAVRPVIAPHEAQKISPSKYILYPVKLPNGQTIEMAKYGEYPQTVADRRITSLLENALELCQMRMTGKVYTFDGAKLDDEKAPFCAYECPEYLLGNGKYIRIKAQSKNNTSILSTGELAQEEKNYWVKVEPVEWLVDNTGYWISKNALISGIQFDINEHYDGNFEKTQMCLYLKRIFSVDVLPTNEWLQTKQQKISQHHLFHFIHNNNEQSEQLQYGD
ncbi:MAG: hypothetical protein ACI4RJ_03805 [Alphaproteobacteria bacterium]